MTAITLQNPPSPLPFRRMFSDAPAETIGSLILALIALPMILALALDPREIAGINPWIKPLKFALSLSLYLGTLAYFAYLLPDYMRRTRWFHVFKAVVLFCIAAEMVWIGGAAFAGTTSHFNTSTPFMAAMYSLMGIFAVTLTAASLVWGIAIWRSNPGPFARLVAASFVLTFVLTLPVAGYMAQQSGHFVGEAVSDAGGLWLMGWSRSVGDLRVAHFFATHAMQILPLVYVALLWLAGARLPKGTGLALCAAFSALTLATFLQALAGQPFLGWL